MKGICENIEKISAQIKMSLDNPIFYKKRGDLYFILENYDGAIKDYNRAIELNCNKSSYYNRRGNVFYELEKYEEAIKDYDKAIELKPNEAIYHNKCGNIFYKLKKYNEAIKEYTRAIKYGDSICIRYYSYSMRGNTYYRLEKYKEALDDYAMAIKLGKTILQYSGNAAAYNVYTDEEDTHENKKVKELKENGIASFYNMRGNIFYILGKYETALKEYTIAIKYKSYEAICYSNRGETYLNLKEYKLAIKDYSKSIELEPNEAVYYFNRGYIYLKLKQYDSAIENYNLAIIKEPKNDTIHIYRGYTYIKKRMYREAFDDFFYTKKDALEIVPIVAKMDDYDEVIPHLLDFNENDFFNTTINQDRYKAKNKELYKSIFARILKILTLSLVNNKDEKLFAHYTTKEVMQNLLLKEKSSFRLNSIITTNDPEEGKTIYNFFNIDEEASGCKINNDYQAFIGCFTFNYENLNQFRLYGKNQNQEATGISLNFNKNFFNDTINSSSILAMKDIENKENMKNSFSEKIDQDIKYPLFRCIYVDSELRKVVSLGHKSNYLFYRENSSLPNSKIEKMIKTYIEDINAKKKQISILMTQIADIIDKENQLNVFVLYKLFLPLRYIIKHIAFQEEQECRIICVRDLDRNRDDIKFTVDYTHMYIDYRKITNDCLYEIIFAPKAEGGKVLKEAFKKSGVTCKCRKSSFPFA